MRIAGANNAQKQRKCQRHWVGLKKTSPELAEGFVQSCPESARRKGHSHFSVLTYKTYAPRLNLAAALLDGLF